MTHSHKVAYKWLLKKKLKYLRFRRDTHIKLPGLRKRVQNDQYNNTRDRWCLFVGMGMQILTHEMAFHDTILEEKGSIETARFSRTVCFGCAGLNRKTFLCLGLGIMWVY